MFGFVFGVGLLIAWLVSRNVHKNQTPASDSFSHSPVRNSFTPHWRNERAQVSSSWIAVKAAHPQGLIDHLKLTNTTPCTWSEGTTDLRTHHIFISPPIHGWILIFGGGLPGVCEDVDRFYRFFCNLSLEMGQTHFFHFNRIVDHHAWGKADKGRILRAYAWAGETLWNQGSISRSEIGLKLSTSDYGDCPMAFDGRGKDTRAINSEKVGRLAGIWSVDPAMVNDPMFEGERGIIGEVPQYKLH